MVKSRDSSPRPQSLGIDAGMKSSSGAVCLGDSAKSAELGRKYVGGLEVEEVI